MPAMLLIFKIISSSHHQIDKFANRQIS